MITFLIGLLILFLDIFFIQNILKGFFAPDDREVPAVSIKDGVDFYSFYL